MIRFALIWFIAFSATAAAAADTPAEEKAKKTAERRQIAKDLKVFSKVDEKTSQLRMVSQPLYMYHEVARGFHHASTWAWKGDSERPSMILNLSGRNSLFYEFVSLTNNAVSASTLGTTWAPKSNGWNPKVIVGARAPGRSRAIRLSQMRSIAKKHVAYQVDHEKGGKDRYLRLLPQPIYRYQKESKQALDGALFAFVRDGDLEVILTIEASKEADNNSSPKWMFDCDRVAIFEQHVTYNGEEVWECPRTSSTATSPNTPYYVLIRNASIAPPRGAPSR